MCDVVASSAELSDCNTYVDGSALDVPWVGHPGDILMRQTAPSAKSLTGWGKKRLCSLMVRQRILLYLFSRWQQWWMLSFSILWNLWGYHTSPTSLMLRRWVLMMIWAVLITSCRIYGYSMMTYGYIYEVESGLQNLYPRLLTVWSWWGFWLLHDKFKLNTVYLNNHLKKIDKMETASKEKESIVQPWTRMPQISNWQQICILAHCFMALLILLSCDAPSVYKASCIFIWLGTPSTSCGGN